MRRLSIFACGFASLLMATDLSAECRYGKKVVTGPTGKTIVACLDGKYTTCMYDSQRAGHSREHALSYCGRLRDQGRVK